MTWTRVYSSPQQHLTALMVDLLVNNGIEAVIVSKRESMYPIGFYEAHVPESKLAEATAIVDAAIAQALKDQG
jgi:hypothetical protein